MAQGKTPGLVQRQAFKALIAKSRERLYRMAYAWTHDPDLADDLVQHSLYKALCNEAQLKELGAGEAWLFRILNNSLMDHLRAKRETLPVEDCVLTDGNTPEQDSERQQLVDTVRAAVAKLPLGQRQVVTLVDLEGFTYVSVAEILEIPVGTVMSRLCRGRRSLKEHLVNLKKQHMEPKASPVMVRVK